MRCYIEKIENVKIENYNHHDGEQLLFLKIKKKKEKEVPIKTQSKKKDVLEIFILLLYNPLYYCKKRRTPICLIKTVEKPQKPQENVIP